MPNDRTDAGEKPPYVMVSGTLKKVLEKIKVASVPERFTQDFLATKLGFKGGNAKTIIPFLKKIGFLASDGSPTDIYKRFRNTPRSGAAMAEAIRVGYAALYELNEYVHAASDEDLLGIVVQATGSEADSSTVQAILQSFKALKGFATFDVPEAEGEGGEEAHDDPGEEIFAEHDKTTGSLGMNLSYTINLNLPASSDIAVFDAIFKSLREHLLRR
jgi:hypothetical protein